MSYKANFVIKVILAAILIAISYLFLNLIFPLITGDDINSFLVGENLPITNPKNFVAVLKVTDGEDGKIAINLLAILLPSKSHLAEKLECIDNVYIGSRITYHNPKNTLWDLDYIELAYKLNINNSSMLLPGYGGVPYIEGPGKRFSFSEICAGDSPKSVSGDNLKSISLESGDLSFDLTPEVLLPTYYYPFDRRYVQIDVTTGFDVIGEVFSSEWYAEPMINSYEDTVNLKPKLEIEYKRPLPARILSATLLIMLFSITIISMFIKDTNNYFAILIGILLGMSGLRPVLGIPDLSTKTMIDAFFLSLYFLLGLTFIVRFTIFPLWNFTTVRTSEARIIKKRNDKLESVQHRYEEGTKATQHSVHPTGGSRRAKKKVH